MIRSAFAKRFFSSIQQTERKDISIIMVTHLLQDRPLFLEALKERFTIHAVIPKPKSINHSILQRLEGEYNFVHTSRKQIRKTSLIQDLVGEAKGKVILLDIGGYFASIVGDLLDKYEDKIVGIIEDTENGFQKYKKVGIPEGKFVSVARSVLKKAEDHHIGRSIVFSIEHLLRQENILLNAQTVGIIGYGKIGKSVAEAMAERNLHVSVYDNNPLKQLDAVVEGKIAAFKETILTQSDIIVSATGNKALNSDDIEKIKRGSFVATVTSSDDELDFPEGYIQEYGEEISKHIRQIITPGDNKVFMLNDGNAVNFLHGASVGHFIYLLQAEIIQSIYALISPNQNAKINNYSISQEEKRKIAELRLHKFSIYS